MNKIILSVIGIIIGLLLMFYFYENPNLNDWKYCITICAAVTLSYTVPAIVLSLTPLKSVYNFFGGWFLMGIGLIVSLILNFVLAYFTAYRKYFAPIVIGCVSGFFFMDSIEIIFLFRLPTWANFEIWTTMIVFILIAYFGDVRA